MACRPRPLATKASSTTASGPPRRQGRAPRAHAYRLLPLLMEQGYGVGDARDEPAQAGEQQQFFDLPDHEVLPRKVPEIPITRVPNPPEPPPDERGALATSSG
jgi:hypothetical protein